MPTLRKPKVEDLNLIPLMNLFVTMIPLLLLTAAFYHIGMVSVSVPVQAPPGDPDDVPKGKASVTLNARMSDKGITLSASSATIGETELKALDGFIPKKGKEHDYASLTKALEKIKRRYEQSDTMMLVPDKNSKYNEMISVMDAARNMEVPYKGKKRKIPLFPVVVVTSLLE